MTDQLFLEQSVYYFLLNIFHIGEIENHDFHYHNLYHRCYSHHDVHDGDPHAMLPIRKESIMCM